MPKAKKKMRAGGLGNAIANDKKKRIATQPGKNSHVDKGNAAPKSCLVQNSLEEFMDRASKTRREFEVEKEYKAVFDAGSLVRSYVTEENAAKPKANVYVPIPRRPKWTKKMTAEELDEKECKAFDEWRRKLADIEEKENTIMTPYEKNLDFWRQLWRVIERSDVVVQILDARNPLFYWSKDLMDYVKEVHPDKKCIFLMNKCDFLSDDLRERWKAMSKERGVEIIFFSALRELHELGFKPGIAAPLSLLPSTGLKKRMETAEHAGEVEQEEEVPDAPHGNLDIEDPDVLSCTGLLNHLETVLAGTNKTSSEDKPHQKVVGFCGFPNVGKSSVINALVGEKKTSTSRMPGKTKHFQTLNVPGRDDMILCDCPGLVFPSVVSTREDLVLSGVVPIEHMRDYMPSINRLVAKVGLYNCLEHYHCTKFVPEIPKNRQGVDPNAEARAFLTAYAKMKKYFLRMGEPDTHRGAVQMLKDITSGALLHCEPPPDAIYFAEQEKKQKEKEQKYTPAPASSGSAAPAAAYPQRPEEVVLDELDGHMDNLFLDMEQETKNDQQTFGRMTKKKQRFMRKDHLKNKMGVSSEGYISGIRPEQLKEKYKIVAANFAATNMGDNDFDSDNDQ